MSAAVAATLAPVLAGIDAYTDPFERIALANHYVDALRSSVSDGAAVRRAAVRELRRGGMTPARDRRAHGAHAGPHRTDRAGHRPSRAAHTGRTGGRRRAVLSRAGRADA